MADETTRLKNVFWDARKRCNNPNHKYYKNYGGRGIVCEWKTFKEFYTDMGNTYLSGLTLERIDNEKNYNKANCRWATRKEQANNRRTNRMVLFQGIRKTLTQWIDHFGLKSSTVRQRYYGYKMSLDRCFEQKGGQVG